MESEGRGVGGLAAWLPLGTVLPDPRQMASLPVETAAGSTAVTVAAAPEGRWPARRLWLWATLDLGTVSLTAMVVLLRRK